MSAFATKLFFLGGGTCLLTGGSYVLYTKNLPKDIKEALEREGYTLATEDEAFKALSFDHRSYISELSIDSLNSNTGIEEAYSKLKTWCQTQYDQKIEIIQNLEALKKQVIKFCKDKPLTVRGKLIRLGNSSLIKDTEDEEYKTVYALYKTNLSSLLKKQNTNLGNVSTNEEGKNLLKTWCTDNLTKKVEESKGVPFKELSWYCVPLGYKTVKDKLDQESWKLADESSETNVWQTLFEKWKHTKDVIESLKKKYSSNNLSDKTDKSEGGPKLKSWCEDGLKKNLSEDGVYPSEYVLIKSACTNSSIGTSKS